jgi:hypothetical protein
MKAQVKNIWCEMKTTNETCNECGKSVAFGSGNFVNRTPDFNSVADREAMGKPYPYGDYICAECEHKYSIEHPF